MIVFDDNGADDERLQQIQGFAGVAVRCGTALFAVLSRLVYIHLVQSVLARFTLQRGRAFSVPAWAIFSLV